MTSSWNNFSLGKMDPKESTTTPAAPLLGTSNLNLASLAPQETPVAPRPQTAPATPGGGNLLDAGSGFVSGFGKQAVGTLDSIFGVDNALLKKNIAAGGSGSTAEGMGWIPAAGKLLHGVSQTVSLVYNNPDALLKIPGQLSNQWNNGDMRTRGDLAGQATFIIGSLFVGGTGAAKAGKIAGDVREASVLTKGMSTLSETGTTMRGLETTVTGLREATALGKSTNLATDVASLTRGSTALVTDGTALARGTSLLGDGTNLARTSTLVTDGTILAREANALTRGTGVVDQAATGIARTGSLTERVLPGTESATKFLVRGGETAESLQLSMPNRLFGLRATEQAPGVVSKFLERFKPVAEVETSLAGSVQGSIPSFGRGLATDLTGAGAASDLSKVGKVADVVTDGSSLARVVDDLGHVPGVTGLTTDAGRISTATNVTADAGRLTGAGNLIDDVGKTGATAERLTAGGATKAEVLPGTVPGTLPGTVPEITGAARTAQTVPEITGAARTAQTVPEITGAARTAQTVPEITGAVRTGQVVPEVTGAVRTGQVVPEVTGAVRTGQVVPEVTGALRTAETVAPQVVRTERAAAQVGEQLAPHVSQFAEQANLLKSTGNLGARGETAFAELETGLTKFRSAATAGERAEGLAQMNNTLRVLEQQGIETAGLRSSLTNLQTQTRAAEHLAQVRTATAEIAQHSSALTTQTAELTTKFGARSSLTELEQAAKQLSQAGAGAERLQALRAVETAAAKVSAEIPEAGAALRTTVESLKAPVQFAAKSEAAQVVTAQIAERSAQLTKQVSELGPLNTAAMRELDVATKQLAQAGSATERAQALAAVERASAKVVTEVPAETAAALRTTVEALKSPVQVAARTEAAELAAAQIAERSSALTTQTTELAAKYGTRGSVQELSTATKQFNEAVSLTDKARALESIERASVRVANEFPEASAGLRQTVGGLKTPLQTAARAEAGEVVAAQIAQRSEQLAGETARLASKYPENLAVSEFTAASKEFSQATSAAQKAEAYSRMERAATAIREVGPEGAQVARTVESLAAPVETAARAQRIERAIATVDEQAAALSSQTSTLARELAVEGKVPATVRELDAAATRMSQATTTAEKAQAYQALKTSAAEVATEFPGKTAQISKTVESMAPHLERAERLVQFENVSSRVAYQADDLAREAAYLKNTAGSGLKSEAALTELQTSATAFKAATTTERAEQLAQMNRNLRLIEAEVGEAKVAGLRTTMARLENEVGTFERVAAIEKSTAQIGEHSQNLIRQTAQLESQATTTAGRLSLENLRVAATDATTANALERVNLLNKYSSEIAAIEREMGTAAAAQVRTSVMELDRAAALTRANTIELVEYQGAKMTQQLGHLQEGQLGSRVQALRVEQLQHDLAVMKSVVPGDSAIAPHLVKLEHQVYSVDAIANILAHPEVARAPGRELLKLSQSADAATAQAAADRLILSGRYEKLGEGPVSGLITQRAQFWKENERFFELDSAVKSKLFESGKVFGLPVESSRFFGMPVSDPIFKKLLLDIAATTGGIALLDGVLGYNLNKLSAMARDNVLSAEYEAKARQENQPKQEAEIKPDEVKSQPQPSSHAAGQQSGQQTAAQQTGGQTTDANAAQLSSARREDESVIAAAPHTADSGDTYVRTSHQAVFHHDANEVKMSPAMQVYGTPKFLAADEINEIPAGSFPTAGASWWWKQQHGGNPWGFQRGPGAPPPQEEVKQTVTVTPRARGMSATPEADLTKIAQVRFPIPRVMDITNQSMLLNSTNQFQSRAGRPGSNIGGATGAKTWTTVDWTQVGSQRLASASEGGKSNQDMTKLERDEEGGLDVSGGGSTSAQNPQLAANNNDPTAADPSAAKNDPNVVVAQSQPVPLTQDDELTAKV